MRINEFTQNKLSEAVPKGVRKDFDVNSIPKNNREAAYLKQLKLIQTQLKVGKNTKSVLGLRDYQTDPDADGGQETPMDPVDDDPMSAVNQEKDRTTVPTGGFNINKRKVVGTRPRTTFTSLAKASGIADPNKIKVGQKITLPSGGTYNVVSGDTLSGIAQRVRTGKIGGGGNDGTTTQSNLAPPKATPKKDFGLGGLDVTGPVRRGDGKNSAVKDLPPVRNVKTFKTTPLQTNKVDPDDAMTAPNQAKDRMTKPVNRINRGTDPSNMVTPQLGATPNRVSQGSTTAKKSVGDAGGFTGKFIDKKGNVAYTSPKAFAQNLLPGVFGTPKGQEIPSNLKRINPATKGAEKGTRFQQVDAPKPVNKDANFFSKEFGKMKSDFKTAVDTTKKNFGPGRNTLASKGTSNIIGNKNFVSDKK